MILIFSKENDDSTCEVCGWLHRTGKKFIRINDTDNVNVIINDFDVQITIRERVIDLSIIESSWFKWDSLRLNVCQDKLMKTKTLAFNFLQKEKNVIRNYIFFILQMKKTLGYPNSSINKLCALFEAKKVGFEVPKSYCYSKNKIILDNRAKYIHKPLSDEIFTHNKEFILQTISDEYHQSEEDLGLTTVQEIVEAELEIRVLFFKGHMYATYFKKKNTGSAVNMKKVSFLEEVRNIYEIPQLLRFKITNLMKALNLNYGCLDILKIKELFFFLEVNPHGQYGYMLDLHTEPISKQIASIL